MGNLEALPSPLWARWILFRYSTCTWKGSAWPTSSCRSNARHRSSLPPGRRIVLDANSNATGGRCSLRWGVIVYAATVTLATVAPYNALTG